MNTHPSMQNNFMNKSLQWLEDNFCHASESLWDYNQLWNTTTPAFTPCFRNTFPIWLPAAILWLSAPHQVYHLTKSIGTLTTHIPLNRYNVSRMLLVVIIILVNVIRFGYDLTHFTTWDDTSEWQPSIANLTASLVNVFTFALFLFLIHLHRLSGSHTSALAWHFTFLSAIFSIPAMYMLSMLLWDRCTFASVEPHYKSLDIILNVIHLSAILVLFVLTCIADERPSLLEATAIDDEVDDSFDSDRTILLQRSLSHEEAQNSNLAECPDQSASFLSQLTYWWFNSLASTGYKRKLQLDDFWQLAPEDKADFVSTQFAKSWKSQIKPGSTKPPGALWTLLKTFSGLYLYGAMFQMITILLSFVHPQLLKIFIEFISNVDEPIWHGFFIGIVMFSVACIHSVCFVYFLRVVLTVGMRVRNSLISAIYRKSLTLSSAARHHSSTGQIINLMSTDAQDFVNLLADVDLIWSAPVQVILTMYFLWLELGPSVLAGIGVMLLLMPINWLVSKLETTVVTAQMATKDERVNVISESLNSLKCIKLYGWEVPFIEKISAIRNKETIQIRQIAYLNAITSTIWNCAPFLVAFSTFAVYVLSSKDNVLDAKKAFVSLSLFELLRYPLSNIPEMINQFVVSMVSIRRLNRYLNASEIGKYVTREQSFFDEDIVIEDGSFSWGQAEAVVVADDDTENADGSENVSSTANSSSSSSVALCSINLRIKKGSLVAIVGQVGSGKSSLLSAILGDMELVEGCVNINQSASIAYVSQQAWIQNATLRDNILFGSEYDPSRYNRILHMCDLLSDIKMLPGGDQIEIGEKGINLSGGQKQRVAIARACYAASDIVLFDDPLSAVDSHVAKHIFTHVLSNSTGYLQDKTRVLVTNDISFLPEVDQIVVLVKGQISEIGTYQELLECEGKFAEFLNEHSTQSTTHAEESKETIEKNVRPATPTAKDIIPDKLIEDETTEEGKVKWSVYMNYFRSLTYFWLILMLIGFVAMQFVEVGTDVWLTIWSNDQSGPNATQNEVNTNLRNERLTVYGLLGLTQAIIVFATWVALANGTVKSSIRLHRSLLDRIMRSPMSFFDTTPIGRIVNRFSRDMDCVDSQIPFVINSWMLCALHVLAILVLIIFQIPMFIVVVFPVFILYYFIQKFYISTSRQITRLESITRSPIFSHFGETLAGVSTIRAFGHNQRMIAESNRRVDANQRTFFPDIMANRWLALRLEFCGNLIILFAAIFSVLKREAFHSEPAFAGLIMYYAMSITDSLTWLVRNTSEMESAVVSVERIGEYCQLETEGEWTRDVNRFPNLASSWPEQGTVKMENYSVRYREGLEPVLKNICIDIKAGEKIGIVGRTGAGKSSLTLGLFRILEASQGRILIDGIDISRIGLHELRSKLSIIPQDPVLFSGTIRSNLDPLQLNSDEQLWKALEHCHLKSMVTSLPSGLDAPVAENGSNLSVGERQLICLGRALLRGTRILVLDEATAAVDLETDSLVQATIAEHLGHCTILTIAHRLHTVRHADRVLALQQGTIAEFDTPDALLQDQNSIFTRSLKMPE